MGERHAKANVPGTDADYDEERAQAGEKNAG